MSLQDCWVDPQDHDIVTLSSDKALAGQGQGPDRVRKPLLGNQLPGRRVPDPHCPVVAAGDDDVAAPGPACRHRSHRAGVAGQRRPTGCPVTASQTRTVPSLPPETMTSRPPARPTATAVTQPVWPVSGGADRLPAHRIPNPHRPVVAAGDDDIAAPGPA